MKSVVRSSHFSVFVVNEEGLDVDALVRCPPADRPEAQRDGLLGARPGPKVTSHVGVVDALDGVVGALPYVGAQTLKVHEADGAGGWVERPVALDELLEDDTLELEVECVEDAVATIADVALQGAEQRQDRVPGIGVLGLVLEAARVEDGAEGDHRSRSLRIVAGLAGSLGSCLVGGRSPGVTLFISPGVFPCELFDAPRDMAVAVFAGVDGVTNLDELAMSDIRGLLTAIESRTSSTLLAGRFLAMIGAASRLADRGRSFFEVSL
ncbi:hypothetical protein HYQ46_013120 [Verticillium longisporum]|nr:hypothetical protein HYQ46_013120 [Verticillium longisporum]